MPYIHTEELHNTRSAEEIIPVLIDLFHPASVIDVGCGIGTFLAVFRRYGVADLLGMDGHWVNKELLGKYISTAEFREADLQQPLRIDRRFDLALCLEVAEHLRPEAAEVLVHSLVQLSDIIIFSAALPGQGGENHINEQYVDYWQEKFLAHDYYFHDVFRPWFWNNPNIFWWYRQNMFLVANEKKLPAAEVLKRYEVNRINNYVHPELLMAYVNEYEKMMKGKLGAWKTSKIALKAILSRLRIIK